MFMMYTWCFSFNAYINDNLFEKKNFINISFKSNMHSIMSAVICFTICILLVNET